MIELSDDLFQLWGTHGQLTANEWTRCQKGATLQYFPSNICWSQGDSLSTWSVEIRVLCRAHGSKSLVCPVQFCGPVQYHICPRIDASRRSDLTYFLRLRRKAELEVLSSLAFGNLSPTFLPQLTAGVNTRHDLPQAWNALEKVPMIVAYLVTKLSAYLPPLVGQAGHCCG